MTTKQRFIAFAAVPLLALALACGGGGDKDESSSGENGGGSQSSSNSGNNNSSSSSSNDGALSAANCSEYTNFAMAYAASLAPTGSPSGTKVDENMFKNLASKAPGEIKGDMQVIADAMVAYLQVINSSGINFNDPNTFRDPAKLQKLQEASEKLDTDKVQKAADKVEAYFEKNCR